MRKEDKEILGKNMKERERVRKNGKNKPESQEMIKTL
jgi:hypothetical protein